MPTRVVRSEQDVDKLVSLLATRKFPMTITFVQGEARTKKQNRLAQRWFTDISRQVGDQTHEDIRAECKLTIGVPILRAENEAFRTSYDKSMKRLTYEEKLNAIKAFDLPVTRLMTTKQMSTFVDEMQRTWIPRGIRLTDPEALKYEEEFT